MNIAEQCRYNDCRHQTEPGCAVRKAIEDNTISKERFESYIKQSGELSKEHRQFQINRNRRMKRQGIHPK